MTVLLECPWCPDGNLAPLADAEEDLVCVACNIRVTLAPDPSVVAGREAA